MRAAVNHNPLMSLKCWAIVWTSVTPEHVISSKQGNTEMTQCNLWGKKTPFTAVYVSSLGKLFNESDWPSFIHCIKNWHGSLKNVATWAQTLWKTIVSKRSSHMNIQKQNLLTSLGPPAHLRGTNTKWTRVLRSDDFRFQIWKTVINTSQNQGYVHGIGAHLTEPLTQKGKYRC